jgi:hypothetical protein
MAKRSDFRTALQDISTSPVSSGERIALDVKETLFKSHDTTLPLQRILPAERVGMFVYNKRARLRSLIFPMSGTGPRCLNCRRRHANLHAACAERAADASCRKFPLR